MTDLLRLKLLQQKAASCVKCDLHLNRIKSVFSRGNPEASICFTGEAPGQSESEQGIPFVGASGKMLDQTLVDLGLDVEKDIYVNNVVKCHPPNNRKPTDHEINCCADYLEEQLKLVNPKVIVALGNTAVSGLLPIEGGITKIHGKFFKRGSIFVMPAFHPSYVIRNGGKGIIYDQFKADLQSAINKSKELT